MCEYVHLCPYLGVLSLGMCVCVCVGVGGLVGKFVGVGLCVCVRVRIGLKYAYHTFGLLTSRDSIKMLEKGVGWEVEISVNV